MKSLLRRSMLSAPLNKRSIGPHLVCNMSRYFPHMPSNSSPAGNMAGKHPCRHCKYGNKKSQRSENIYWPTFEVILFCRMLWNYTESSSYTIANGTSDAHSSKHSHANWVFHRNPRPRKKKISFCCNPSSPHEVLSRAHICLLYSLASRSGFSIYKYASRYSTSSDLCDS